MAKKKNKKEGILLSELSNDELKEMFESAYEAVYVSECYNVRDMLLITGAGEELKKRGIDIDISTRHKVKFSKPKKAKNKCATLRGV